MANPFTAYLEAVDAEGRARDAALLRLPQEICDVAVRPLTLRDYLWLSAARSPFLCGGKPDFADAALLLWHQAIIAGEKTDEKRRHFLRALECLDVETLIGQTSAYVADAMADAPKGEGKRGKSYYSIAVPLIHTYRRAYGASRDEALDTPLDELWQVERHLRRERDPSTIFFNPSDTIQREVLTAYAARKKAKAAANQTIP